MICKRWYHTNVSSSKEAESLLLAKGYNGSFLIRPSLNYPGDYTLSVRHDDVVYHIKIENTGEFYHLFGVEMFATLAELVQCYKEDKLSIIGGPTVYLLRPFYAVYPTNERWYHGNITKATAETLLAARPQGTFLVRKSISQPGRYVLSVKSSDSDLAHILIDYKEDKYSISGKGERPEFDSLTELVEFYRQRNQTLMNQGTVAYYLKQPVNSSRINVSDIKDRVSLLDKAGERGVATERGGTAEKGGGFNEEFEFLQREDNSNLLPRNNGKNPANAPKNRYKNILPFDHSRVILKEGDPALATSDYINANYITIDDEGSPQTMTMRVYIATQGCLFTTIGDFWRMIWQENSCVIVNLTNLVEKGKNKCVFYWTKEEEPARVHVVHGGHFVVTHKSHAERDDYVIRELELERFQSSDEEEEPRSLGTKTIYQFHYRAWPAKSVPSEPGILLGCMHDVHACSQSLPSCGPIVVHCSAGIGRTGVWIIIDMILNDIKKFGLECEIDVQKTVQRLRAQRSGMVQTEQQYRFIYIAIKHYIETVSQRLATPGLASEESTYGNLYADPLALRGVSTDRNVAGASYENVNKS